MLYWLHWCNQFYCNTQTKTFWDMSITVQTLFMFFISISLLIPSVYSFRFDKWKLYMICAGNWVIFSRAVKFLVDGAKISGSQDLVSYKWISYDEDSLCRRRCKFVVFSNSESKNDNFVMYAKYILPFNYCMSLLPPVKGFDLVTGHTTDINVWTKI